MSNTHWKAEGRIVSLVLSGVHTEHDIVRHRRMSYDVVRCRCNWTHWFNDAVHITARRRTTSQRHWRRNWTWFNSVARSSSSSYSFIVGWHTQPNRKFYHNKQKYVVRHRASRHPALSYDVVRSVNTALVCRVNMSTCFSATTCKFLFFSIKNMWLHFLQ